MKIRYLSLSIFAIGFFLSFTTFSQAPANRLIYQLEIPKANLNQITYGFGYALSYNETYEQANWVAYELTKEETYGQVPRTNNFYADRRIKTKTANVKDYKGSGYDRGHLAPAADMGWDRTAMSQSFSFANISPQLPGFNRGIWKRLESLVRKWAVENEAVYVVTGPVLQPGLPTIGKNRVAVPKYYYKVVLDYRNPEIKAIGFIMEAVNSQRRLQDFAVTVDSVEQLTGIDFFYKLEDAEENYLEASLDLHAWNWKTSSTTVKDKEVKSVYKASAEQCKGVTKTSDRRCKNKTTNNNSYCYLHQAQNSTSLERENNQAARCTAFTLSGRQCKRLTKNSNRKCWQHQ